MDEVLREKIKELLRVPPLKKDCRKPKEHYDPFVANPICEDCSTDQILALIKEAREETDITIINEAIEDSFKAGRREVVKWIKEEISMQTTDGGIFISGYIAGEKWQAKLREWRILDE